MTRFEKAAKAVRFLRQEFVENDAAAPPTTIPVWQKEQRTGCADCSLLYTFVPSGN